jgi:hypothetical protein
MTSNEFILRSKEIFEGLSYSKVKYINSHTKVVLTCGKHGDFEIIPNNHLSGQSCKICGNYRRKISILNFSNRANEIHKDEYIYKGIKFNGVTDYVNIECRKHGLFKQRVSNHLNGQGCPKCYGNKPISTDEFIKNQYLYIIKNMIIHWLII